MRTRFFVLVIFFIFSFVLVLGDSEDNLIFDFGFDENVGGVVFDSVDGEVEGVVHGATWTSECISGSCLSFDGIDDYVEILHDDDFNLEAGTIFFWFKADVVPFEKGDWNMLFGKPGYGQEKLNNYVIWLDPSSRIKGSVGNSTSFEDVAYGDVLDDEWHNFAFMFDENGLEAYYDGELVDEVVYSDNEKIIPFFNEDSINIGSFAGKYAFDGIIDELKIYDEVVDYDFIRKNVGLKFDYEIENQYKFLDEEDDPLIRVVPYEDLGEYYFVFELENLETGKLQEILVEDLSEEEFSRSFDLGDGFYEIRINLIFTVDDFVEYSVEDEIVVSSSGPVKELMHFSFMDNKNYDEIDQDFVDGLVDSPYTAIAVPLMGAYDYVVPSYESYDEAVSFAQFSNGKIWPLVSSNIMIGCGEVDGCSDHWVDSMGSCEDDVYFSGIDGMDLWDEEGGLSKFYEEFELSLNVAKNSGSGGVIFDFETYNNYCVNDFSYLADKTGRSEEEIKNRLYEVGEEMADIVNGVYPSAKLWFYVLRLPKTDYYIAKGMLDRSKEKGYDFLVIGRAADFEDYYSFDSYKDSLWESYSEHAFLFSDYDNFRWAGHLAPYDDLENTKNPTLLEYYEEYLGLHELLNLEDFDSLFEYNFKAFEYCQVYGYGYGIYSEFRQSTTLPYRSLIESNLVKVEGEVVEVLEYSSSSSSSSSGRSSNEDASDLPVDNFSGVDEDFYYENDFNISLNSFEEDSDSLGFKEYFLLGCLGVFVLILLVILFVFGSAIFLRFFSNERGVYYEG